MLNVTFEMFILHYIMEYVGNLCSPLVPYMSSQKGELIIVSSAQDYGFIIRRKYFVGNLSTCIITNSEYL